MNSELENVNWDSELHDDIEQAWMSFKTILFRLMDKYITKIKVGGKTQPSWFDAEVYQQCRDKERCHQQYKNAKNNQPEDASVTLSKYLTFSAARKKFKNLVSKKLNESFEDEDDTNLITKKFWSYVKANSNNTRIPEMINLDDTFKSKPLEQANLFNSFFYKQFSQASSYDVPIDFDIDGFDISFDQSRIIDILKHLNPSKAMGPDKIHGHVLKNCCNSISIPLSILFKKSYYSGSLPSEWKLALVVPVQV